MKLVTRARSSSPSSVKLPSLVEVDAQDQVLLDRVVGHYAEALASHEGAQGVPGQAADRRPGGGRAVQGRVRRPHPGLPAAWCDHAGREPGQGQAPATRGDQGVAAEHFRGYVTFPVLDVEGRTGEIYGRLLGKPDPRSAPPKHLYLPGPHRGVWNIAAFAETDELIVCESIIDALTLWCAGFRHVTAAYGTDGWTPEHQTAVQEHGIRRVLIAFDADPAGDKGAKTLAAELATVGVQSYRVELPPGSDVNEVAVGAKLPAEALGKHLRKAAWMDALARPVAQSLAAPQPEPVVPAAAPESPEAASEAPAPVPAPVPEPVPSLPPAAIVEPGLYLPVHVVEPVEPEAEESAHRVAHTQQLPPLEH